MTRSISVAIVLIFVMGTLALSQTIQHPWWVVDRGGGKSTAPGGFTLQASIGQTAVQKMEHVGSGLVLESGYIPGLRGFYSSLATAAIDINPKWNLVSVPLIVDDFRKTTLFPTAKSRAWAYEHESYAAKDTLSTGAGYWLKFPAAETVTISGVRVDAESVVVDTGWNLIGSVSFPLPIVRITSDPPGLITSEFYGYQRKYIVADTIYPGKGYWVKVSSSGRLFLSLSTIALAKSSARIRIMATKELPPPPPGGDANTEPATGGQASGIPDRFALEQNYPNPFNPATDVRYAICDVSFVSLKVYDVLGREVATLVNEVKQPSEYTVRWDASAMPSGVYYCKLVAGTFTDVKKLLLLK